MLSLLLQAKPGRRDERGVLLHHFGLRKRMQGKVPGRYDASRGPALASAPARCACRARRRRPWRECTERCGCRARATRSWRSSASCWWARAAPAWASRACSPWAWSSRCACLQSFPACSLSQLFYQAPCVPGAWSSRSVGAQSFPASSHHQRPFQVLCVRYWLSVSAASL